MENLTMTTFKEKICECGLDGKKDADWKFKGSIPAIIDFYADWCGPCKMVSPILDQLSVEYSGKVSIYKVNTETERELASAFGISSIPSILFVPMQGKPQMISGALPKHELKRLMGELLDIKG